MNLSQTEGEGLFLKCVSGIGLNPTSCVFFGKLLNLSDSISSFVKGQVALKSTS